MGITALVGPKNTVAFFIKKNKLKGSVAYFTGMIMIILGYPMFTLTGFLIQMFGIFLLF